MRKKDMGVFSKLVHTSNNLGNHLSLVSLYVLLLFLSSQIF